MKTKVTCKRCSGSGRHSFNQRDGEMCYGCMGFKFQMVDVAAAARRTAAAAVKFAAQAADRALYIAAYKAVCVELNVDYGFDLSTPLGLDKLNNLAYRATGLTLVRHTENRLQSHH